MELYVLIEMKTTKKHVRLDFICVSLSQNVKKVKNEKKNYKNVLQMIVL